jgi:hypothetical protein
MGGRNKLTRRIGQKIMIRKRQELERAGKRMERTRSWRAAARAAAAEHDNLKKLAWEARKKNDGWRV